jgi:predicted PurR-regulated permease PerM
MTSVGLIMTLGLLVSGIEYALLLGLITAILDIIPVVGPAIALIICLITAYKSGMLAIILVCVVFAIAQWAENNLVRPYIFSKFLDLHPLIIYLFLFITAQYLGVVGVIFAPAIAATICVLIQELYIKNIS